MALDNNKRAVLSIAALTKLVAMRRDLMPTDASGLVTVEFLERLVINGSVSERDDVLNWFEKDDSFGQVLASKRPLATA
jgi:hypothetical protein